MRPSDTAVPVFPFVLRTPLSLTSPAFAGLSAPSRFIASEGSYWSATITTIEPEKGATGLAALHAGSPNRVPEQMVIRARREHNERDALNQGSKGGNVP